MIKTYERFLIKLWNLKGKRELEILIISAIHRDWEITPKRITRKHIKHEIKHEIKTQYNLERSF